MTAQSLHPDRDRNQSETPEKKLPIPPSPLPSASCPEIGFLAGYDGGKQRLYGMVAPAMTPKPSVAWCYSVPNLLGKPNISPGAPDLAAKTACENHYVDPSNIAPADPAAYLGNCGNGCAQCYYTQGATGWYCAGGPSTFGCPTK